MISPVFPLIPYEWTLCVWVSLSRSFECCGRQWPDSQVFVNENIWSNQRWFTLASSPYFLSVYTVYLSLILFFTPSHLWNSVCVCACEISTWLKRCERQFCSLGTRLQLVFPPTSNPLPSHTPSVSTAPRTLTFHMVVERSLHDQQAFTAGSKPRDHTAVRTKDRTPLFRLSLYDCIL